MAMDSGWLRESGDRAWRQLPSASKSRFMETQTALDRICRITGVDVARLKTIERGPRANPARRFAVWALRDGTQMTQAEIGDLLGMSSSQVAHVLRRLNRGEAPIADWIAKW
jgi:DNA-directed RNA polymerase specialized sigma24 family protein